MNKTELMSFIKNKDFLRLWGSQLFSQITTHLINFILILKIFEMTNSAVAVSLLWIFYLIPAIILGPFSGTIIDLLDKRKTLFYTNLCQAVIVLGYLLVKEQVLLIYPIVFIYSLVNQLYLPAEGSALPILVPKTRYPAANSIFLFTAYGSFLAGFTIAGPLVKLMGKENPFFLTFVFLLLAALAVYKLPKNLKMEKKKVTDFTDFWDQVKAGYLLIKERRSLLFPILLLSFTQIVVAILGVIVPLYATEVLSLALVNSALILVTPAGAGAILGLILLVRFFMPQKRKKRLISAGLFLGSLALFMLALVVPLISLGKIFLAVSASFMLGLCFVFVLLPSQTFIQENAPANFLGRIYGVLGFTITVFSVLPLLLAGTIAELLGVRTLCFIISLIALFLGININRREVYANHP
jgi:MFS family permease